MPAIDDILAVSAAVFAIAAWVVPPVRYLLSFRRKPRDSLAVVGRVIGMFVLAGMLSVVALVLSLLTLAYSRHSGWGWFGLAAIMTFWLIFATVLVVGDHYKRREHERTNTR
jgi:hypothetical protein